MQTSTVYKDFAISKLDGNWQTSCVVSFVYLLIIGLPGAAFSRIHGLSTGWSLLMLPLEWGFAVYFLNLARGGDLSFGKLFDGYIDFQRVFRTTILVFVYTVLWALLLLIPGIIKSYSYAMTDYILKDDPEISGNKAIEKSMAMMEGHKMELFVLDLSFIGWFILALIPLGLGLILLMPYWYTTRAMFYEDLKAEFEGITNSQPVETAPAATEEVTA